MGTETKTGTGRVRRRGRVGRVAWVVALVGLAACTGAGSGGPDGTGPAGRGARDVLTAADMEGWGGEDLLSVIRRARPHWLQARKALTSEIQPISAVVDGVVQPGGVEVLRGYRAGDVEEVRWVNARDATTQYGLSMMSGAVVVKTKR